MGAHRLSFPFIRFTNWKQGFCLPQENNLALTGFHSYASRIGSKILLLQNEVDRLRFPFIRFTNWKQVFVRLYAGYKTAVYVSIHTLHELEARSLFLLKTAQPQRFHSYASRIGSKSLVKVLKTPKPLWFPFIRFTNWKQAESLG
ncbi:hypothetical protein MAESPC_00732 [Microcystis aeruginosa SPC777]|uniref:Uncharacterized protein n=1 Tax=Microcystis aeruginosa SPC777 TaxID=482300 RepID=S3KHP4_MICAE|nr:hypothetical protein MAESPC_00732 [Microcystis aeruginosa SPC777]